MPACEVLLPLIPSVIAPRIQQVLDALIHLSVTELQLYLSTSHLETLESAITCLRPDEMVEIRGQLRAPDHSLWWRTIDSNGLRLAEVRGHGPGLVWELSPRHCNVPVDSLGGFEFSACVLRRLRPVNLTALRECLSRVAAVRDWVDRQETVDGEPWEKFDAFIATETDAIELGDVMCTLLPAERALLGFWSPGERVRELDASVGRELFEDQSDPVWRDEFITQDPSRFQVGRIGWTPGNLASDTLEGALGVLARGEYVAGSLGAHHVSAAARGHRAEHLARRAQYFKCRRQAKGMRVSCALHPDLGREALRKFAKQFREMLDVKADEHG